MCQFCIRIKKSVVDAQHVWQFVLKRQLGMLEDEEGCAYPSIDENMCVRCYQCIKVCPMKENQ